MQSDTRADLQTVLAILRTLRRTMDATDYDKNDDSIVQEIIKRNGITFEDC